MNIKKVVAEHGYTMKEVADKLGISQQAVSQALNGNPTLSRLQDIARVVGVSVAELVADEPAERQAYTVTVCPYCGHELKVTTKVE